MRNVGSNHFRDIVSVDDSVNFDERGSARVYILRKKNI